MWRSHWRGDIVTLEHCNKLRNWFELHAYQRDGGRFAFYRFNCDLFIWKQPLNILALSLLQNKLWSDGLYCSGTNVHNYAMACGTHNITEYWISTLTMDWPSWGSVSSVSTSLVTCFLLVALDILGVRWGGSRLLLWPHVVGWRQQGSGGAELQLSAPTLNTTQKTRLPSCAVWPGQCSLCSQRGSLVHWKLPPLSEGETSLKYYQWIIPKAPF